MAIEIPSKSIYKIENKKVLDNVYKSIEYSYNNIDYVKDVLFTQNIRSYATTDEQGTIGDIFSENASSYFVINTESYTSTFTSGTLITVQHTATRSNGYIIVETQNRTRYDNLSLHIPYSMRWQATDGEETVYQDYESSYDTTIRGEYTDMASFLADLPSVNNRELNDYFGIKKTGDKNFILFFDIVRKDALGSNSNIVFFWLNYELNLKAKVVKTDNVAVKGSTSPILSVSTNELMNNATEISNGQNNPSQSLMDYLEDEIQYAYSQGLETATIKCSVNNYYKYLGTKKEKSIDDDDEEMLFNIGDLVVPMKRTPNGDEPLSMRNGAPKPFIVSGVNIVNSGAIWQELTLVETVLGIITGILATKGNNISGDISIVADSTITPTNYFLLGKRVNGQVVGGSTLVSKANQSSGAKYAPRTIDYYISSDYYMSGTTQETSAQGSGYTLTHPLTITVQGNHINSLNIKFDETKNIYATRLTIDGVEIVNNSISMEQSVNGGLASHTIIINALNVPNAPVILSSINTNL